MTAFFVPGAAPGQATQQAHDELRGYAEACIGRHARPDQIFALSFRHGGADTETRVGEPDPYGGRTVLAIFASHDGYTIVWRGGHASVGRRETYEAVPFD
ncbi:MAG TPA: hypothetical protein VH834_14355 [Solirubrobacteraceae bacterium]|jgi:hypothetical protein